MNTNKQARYRAASAQTPRYRVGSGYQLPTFNIVDVLAARGFSYQDIIDKPGNFESEDAFRQAVGKMDKFIKGRKENPFQLMRTNYRPGADYGPLCDYKWRVAKHHPSQPELEEYMLARTDVDNKEVMACDNLADNFALLGKCKGWACTLENDRVDTTFLEAVRDLLYMIYFEVPLSNVRPRSSCIFSIFALQHAIH